MLQPTISEEIQSRIEYKSTHQRNTPVLLKFSLSLYIYISVQIYVPIYMSV